MEKPSQPNREERFNKKIHGYHGNGSSVEVYENEFLFDRKEMLAFIESEVAQALAEQRDEIVKLIESKKFGSLPILHEKITTSLMRDIYNHAYDEIIASITNQNT